MSGRMKLVQKQNKLIYSTTPYSFLFVLFLGVGSIRTLSIATMQLRVLRTLYGISMERTEDPAGRNGMEQNPLHSTVRLCWSVSDQC